MGQENDITHVERSDLGQIDLIRQMPVTHAIFVPINFFTSLRRLDEIAHVAFIVHLQVDADTPVEGGAGAVDVQVRDASLDDFGQFLARLLIRRDADFGPVARVQLGADGGRETEMADLGEFVEGVALFGVDVGHGDSAFGCRCAFHGRLFGWLRVYECFVEEAVQGTVLGLFWGRAVSDL